MYQFYPSNKELDRLEANEIFDNFYSQTPRMINFLSAKPIDIGKKVSKNHDIVCGEDCIEEELLEKFQKLNLAKYSKIEEMIKFSEDPADEIPYTWYSFKNRDLDLYNIRLLLSLILSKNNDIEPYGKNKQIWIVKNLIYNKLVTFENKEFIFKNDDLTSVYKKNIEIFGVLSYLDKNKYIELGNFNIYQSRVNTEYGNTYFRFENACILVTNKLYKEIKEIRDLKKDNDKILKQSSDSNGKILYQVTYRQREIEINGNYLSKPNFFSENDIVFEYLFRNPNQVCKTEDIEKESGEKIKKPFSTIVQDLGFKGELKKLFFPNMSKRAIQFINPITEKYLKDNNLNNLKGVKTLEK